MNVKLTCARCAFVWTVTHWTPSAQLCPACGGGELTRGAHLRDWGDTDPIISERATRANRRRQAVGR